jgi:hypothetical protein
VLTSFLAQFYEEVPPPRLILVDRALPEADLLAEALQEAAGGKVEISVPQRGDRRRLMEQASRNAVEALERRLAETGTKAKINREMAEFLELPEVPQRIEIYDNSHIQGTNALGAMVVAGPDGFLNSQYRKWNIKAAQSNDDFAMMREVFRRRFARAQEEDPDRESGVWPDLVLIDGGKGQMSAVRETLEELGIDDVPLIAIAKGPHHGREGRSVPFPGRAGEDAAVNSPVLFHLQRLRDEVHRFAIGAHRESAAARSRPARSMKSRHRPGAQAGAAAALRHGGKGARGQPGGSAARARRQFSGGADRVRFLPPERINRGSGKADDRVVVGKFGGNGLGQARCFPCGLSIQHGRIAGHACHGETGNGIGQAFRPERGRRVHQLEMQVRRIGIARIAQLGQYLPGMHGLSRMDENAARLKVAVERVSAAPQVQDHGVAADRLHRRTAAFLRVGAGVLRQIVDDRDHPGIRHRKHGRAVARIAFVAARDRPR